jgi:hypothetical protein
MVRRDDDRAAALRADVAEIVVGYLLKPTDVYRVVTGCRCVYFGMSRVGRCGGSAYPNLRNLGKLSVTISQQLTV